MRPTIDDWHVIVDTLYKSVQAEDVDWEYSAEVRQSLFEKILHEVREVSYHMPSEAVEETPPTPEASTPEAPTPEAPTPETPTE